MQMKTAKRWRLGVWIWGAALAWAGAGGCGKQGEVGGPGEKGQAAPGGGGGGAAVWPRDTEGRTLVTVRGDDRMKFDVTEIRVPAGATVRLEMVNAGAMAKEVMAHNWVLLRPEAPVEAIALEGSGAPTTDYIPAGWKEQILAHTRLLGPGEKDVVEFTLPAGPGRYPYLCTFPGHYFAGMKGVLVAE